MKLFLKILIATTLIVCNLNLLLYTKDFKKYSYEQVVSATDLDYIINKSYLPYDGSVVTPIKVSSKEEEEVVESESPYEYDKHLEKFSEDYLGAINIPDIDVSESIYKSDGEFYLYKDFNKQHNELGEIYLDDRTGQSITGSGALLNGHAVKNGKKFGNFKKLLDIEKQPLIYIWDDKLQKSVTYRMMFVSLIDGDNSGIVMNFKDEDMRIGYYTGLYETAIKQWEEPTPGEYLLLNSCSYIIKDGRYVVIAKKED